MDDKGGCSAQEDSILRYQSLAWSVASMWMAILALSWGGGVGCWGFNAMSEKLE